jgi:hypothetical protein
VSPQDTTLFGRIADAFARHDVCEFAYFGHIIAIVFRYAARQQKMLDDYYDEGSYR